MKKFVLILILFLFMAVPSSSMASMIKCGNLFNHTMVDHINAFESVAHELIQSIKRSEYEEYLRATCEGIHFLFSWAAKTHTCKKGLSGGCAFGDMDDDFVDEHPDADLWVLPQDLQFSSLQGVVRTNWAVPVAEIHGHHMLLVVVGEEKLEELRLVDDYFHGDVVGNCFFFSSHMISPRGALPHQLSPRQGKGVLVCIP